MKSAMFARFNEYHGNHKKKFKSLYDLGGRCLKIRDVCMDFEPYFKVAPFCFREAEALVVGFPSLLNDCLTRTGTTIFTNSNWIKSILTVLYLYQFID